MFCPRADNPLNKKPVEPEKPDLPPVKDMQAGQKGDPPQIKGPVELPEKKSGEEVQLDRPDAGNGGHTFHTWHFYPPRFCKVSVCVSWSKPSALFYGILCLTVKHPKTLHVLLFNDMGTVNIQ